MSGLGHDVSIEPTSNSGTPFPLVSRSAPVRESETVLSSPRRNDDDPPADSSRSSVNTSPVAHRLFPGQVAPTGLEDITGIALGHFVVESRIGTGGMGTVFLARDESLQRPVALKILGPSQTSDPASVQRFVNEARAAARLDHDHVARVFYYGEDQGLHYIAFEYVQGTNLRDLIRARGRLEPAECVGYAVQLAAALCHTSTCGVVHRDIKPSNIIITPQGKAKLVDLGLARKESLETSAHLTVAGTTLGTFDYISPEQAKDPRNVDVRSDIYSLGCTLYHMLTGELPYPEGTVLQRLLDHQDKEPPDPAAKVRRVSPALSALVRKMMAADPKRRCASAEDLLRDLLIIAGAMGLQAMPADSAVMSAWAPRRPGFWAQNGAWISAASLLIVAVLVLQAFPGLIHRFDGSTLATSAEPTIDLRSDPRAQTRSDSGTSTTSADVSTSIASATLASTAPNTTGIIAGGTAHRGVDDSAEANRSSASGTKPHMAPFDLPPLVPANLGARATVDTEPPGPFKIAEAPAIERRPRPGGDVPAAAAADAVGTPSATVGKPHDATIDSSGPFTIAGTGKSYATLEAACTEAREQATIELNFDGRAPAAERPLRLNQKRLVIQAAKGRRPILWFAPRDGFVDPSLTRMITVIGGELRLQNIGLELRVPDSGSASWVLLSLARPERVRLQGVTATILNPRHAQAVFFDAVSPLADGLSKMGAMKDGAPAVPTEVFIERCLLRGEAGVFRWKDSATIRCAIDQSLCAAAEAFLTVDLPTTAMPFLDRNTLSLTRSTLLLGGGLLALAGGDDLAGRPTPLEVTARQTIISCPPDKPLVEQQIPLEVMEFRKSLLWVGEANVFDNLKTFWLVQTTASGAAPQGWDFAAWRNYWGAGESSGSRNVELTWKRDWRQRPWSELTRDDGRFDALPASSASGNNPADWGAPLEALPMDPAASAPAPL